MAQGGLGEGFGAVSLGMLWIVSRPPFFYDLVSVPKWINGYLGRAGFVCPTLLWAPWGQTEAAVLTPQRTCCLQGAVTEQKKPYGSARDNLKCVMWLLSGAERSEDSFMGRWCGGVGRGPNGNVGVGLTPALPQRLAVHNNLPGLCDVKELG